MPPSHTAKRRAAAALAATAIGLCGAFSATPACATEPGRAIEQLLAAAQQDKRGVSMTVSGQVVAGAVLRIEPGQWVELRNQQYSRIVVRLDRIDSVAMP